MKPRTSSNAAASVAYGTMALLVATYIAFVALLMRHDVMPIPVFAGIAAVALAVLLFVAKRCSGIQLPVSDAPDIPSGRRAFGLAAAFSALVSAFCLLVYLPGGFSSDTVNQWRQITGAISYTDWHPALHTLLMAALLKIVDHPAFVLAVQGLCYALAVGFTADVLARWHIPRLLIAALTAYLCLNPAIVNIMLFPWKDCAFAIAVLFLGAQLLDVHFSRGETLSPVRCAALGVMLSLCAILRHNGVAMALAAGTWLLIALPQKWKRLLPSLLIAVLLTLFIRGPLYHAFGIERQHSQLDEIFGVPMTILANIYDQAPDSLDAETVEFLEDVAPRSVYVENNSIGDWNDIKWAVGTVYLNKPYTLPQVYGFALRAAVKEPALALEALGYLMQMPLWPFCDAYWRISPYVDPAATAEFGVSPIHPNGFNRLMDAVNRLSARPIFAWLTWNPGFGLMLVMICCVLFARRQPLSALLLPAMLIAYHLATCAVLSSSTDFRFFLTTPMLAPLCVIGLVGRVTPSVTTSSCHLPQ